MYLKLKLNKKLLTRIKQIILQNSMLNFKVTKKETYSAQ